jgi:hypothetical protein
VVRFETVPEFRGREALRAFFTARSGKQKGYRLKKSFRTLANDAIPNVWEARRLRISAFASGCSARSS